MKTGLNHAVRVTVAALSIVLGLGAAVPAAAQCPGDVIPSGAVNGTDLAELLATWGPCTGCPADIDASGAVDGNDLAVILGAWGPCTNTPAWATLVEALPDPAVVTNPNLRAAITATGLAWRVKDVATQIEFVLIPPGTFQMGCNTSLLASCSGAEGPSHVVTLTRAFYMGRYEVTQAQWQARMGSNPSSFQSASAEVPAAQVANRPVEQVSWEAIQGFLSQTGMRLPTEAEWEYAYRANTTTAFHGFTGYLSGTDDDNLLGSIAWYGYCCGGGSGGQTRPVGTKLGNGYGLHDMSGNVWEWASDWFGNGYYAVSPQNDPAGPSAGNSRVVRGGDWVNNSSECRSSNRSAMPPAQSSSQIGFRVARTP